MKFLQKKMKSKKKTKYSFIVTAPDKLAPGGVSLFCRTLNKFMSEDFYFFYRKSNSYPINKNLLKKLSEQFTNGLSFLVVLINNLSIKAVIINVSFSKISLLRELYYTLICKLFRKPTIIFFHGWQKKDLDFFEKRGTKLIKFILSNCKQIYVLSKEFYDDLRKLNVNNPITITTTMFDDNELTKPEIKTILAKYNPDKYIFNVVFLSRIEKEKGIYEAIEVIKWLNKQQRNYIFNLNIIGNGKEFNNVKKFEDKNIIFHGFKSGESKYEILNKGDIFIFPTYYGEGFPITITEAMACGLPIFTRPVGGIRDFFRPEMGFCSESLDADVIGNSILTMINNSKLSNIALYNYNYAWENFAASKYVKNFENKINNLFDN